MNQEPQLSETELDVAIVGAGIAGCYAAWRLLGADLTNSPLAVLAGQRPQRKLKLRLYESSGRVGGRLWTAWNQQLPDVPIEYGGQGYFEPPPAGVEPAKYPGHVHVHSLVQHFALPTYSLDFGGMNNPFHLRGRRFSLQSFENPELIPYRVSQDEAANLANLIPYAFELIYPGASAATYEQWRFLRPTARLLGKQQNPLLCEISMGDALKQVLSAEAVQFILDTTPLTEQMVSWNCADAMATLLCNECCGLPIKCLSQGYDQLPRKLVEAIGSAEHLRLHHCLQEVAQAADGRLQLTLLANDEPLHVSARHLILALPRAGLEALGASPIFAQDAARQFHQDLPTVRPMAAYKRWAIYPTPWWRELGIVSGPGLTDMALRQAFPMQTQGEQPGAAHADDQRSLFLAAWHSGEDISHSAHWREQLQALYGVSHVPEPVELIDVRWDCPPRGPGAVHLWQPGARSGEVMARMQKPLPNANLYVCGEAYSQEQGWAEGALQSAETMLAQQLALSRPSPALENR